MKIKELVNVLSNKKAINYIFTTDEVPFPNGKGTEYKFEDLTEEVLDKVVNKFDFWMDEGNPFVPSVIYILVK